MKVLVVGEGPHDVGRRDVWCARTHTYVNTEGWLQPIIRGIRAGTEIAFTAETRNGLKLMPRDVARLRPLPAGHGAKALFAKRLALVAKYDVVVYMVDADSTDPSRWNEIVSEIAAGFDAIEGDVACIACVPMAASESWLLADLAAWQAVAGKSPSLPVAPEQAWGARNDPQGGHPHRLFSRICDEVDVKDCTETRGEIASASSLQTLAGRCPVSYPPFAAALMAA